MRDKHPPTDDGNDRPPLEVTKPFEGARFWSPPSRPPASGEAGESDESGGATHEPAPETVEDNEFAWPDVHIPFVIPNPTGSAPAERRGRSWKRPRRSPYHPNARRAERQAAAPRARRARRAERQPAAPRARRATPWDAIGRVVAFSFVAVAAAALAYAGYSIGRGDEQPAAPQPTPISQQAARAGIELRYPEGWAKGSKPPEIPGVNFTTPLVLRADDESEAGIVAGVVKAATGSDLLPTTLRKKLRISTLAPQRVLLGDTQALRYRGVEVDGFDGAFTLYAIPIAEGSVVLACHGPAGARAFYELCERSAATLRLDGVRAFALGPDPGYGKRLAAAIDTLDGALKTSGSRLREARTGRGQARSAAAIGQAFTKAAAKLDSAPVSARDRDSHNELLVAIRAQADAYGRLATAARSGRRDGYRQAADAVRRTDGGVREAVAALEALGYAS